MYHLPGRVLKGMATFCLSKVFTAKDLLSMPEPEAHPNIIGRGPAPEFAKIPGEGFLT